MLAVLALPSVLFVWVLEDLLTLWHSVLSRTLLRNVFTAICVWLVFRATQRLNPWELINRGFDIVLFHDLVKLLLIRV